mgnify:FL=1
MPTLEATYDEGARSWIVRLPGGISLPARDEYAITEIVRRHAPGSAVRYVRGATEVERAALGPEPSQSFSAGGAR